MIRLVIADDHRIFRDGLVALFEKCNDMEIVGVAGDGLKTVLLAREKSPDVIIIDVCMPHLNGVEATRQIKENNPSIKVLALSMISTKGSVTQMLQAGASGYLLKESPFDELEKAIRDILTGKKYIASEVAALIIDDYMDQVSKTGNCPLSVLSNRELEVFHLLVEGDSAKEISKMLHISIKTAETHRRSILEKLNLRNQLALVRFAIREKIIEP